MKRVVPERSLAVLTFAAIAVFSARHPRGVPPTGPEEIQCRLSRLNRPCHVFHRQREGVFRAGRAGRRALSLHELRRRDERHQLRQARCRFVRHGTAPGLHRQGCGPHHLRGPDVGRARDRRKAGEGRTVQELEELRREDDCHGPALHG